MKNYEQTTESQYKVTDWHSGILTCRMMMRQNDPTPTPKGCSRMVDQ